MAMQKTLVFKSWENARDKSLRAVAPCDDNNYFGVAVNCLRDPEIQGSKNRFWAADYVLDEEKASLRFASNDEVKLYMDSVKFSEVLYYYCGEKFDAKVVNKGFNGFSWFISIEITKSPLWKRIINHFKH